MDVEKFKICDAKTFKTSKGDILYYIVVYSSYELIERVFVTKEDYEYILSKSTSPEILQNFSRVYNRAKKAFVIKYIR